MKQVYQASDGTVFDTSEEALTHEQFVEEVKNLVRTILPMKRELPLKDYQALQKIAVKSVDGFWSLSLKEIVTKAYLVGIAHGVQGLEKMQEEEKD